MTNFNFYICGDSFCFEDPDYGPSWVNLLKDALPNINIINLASPGASNYLIFLQVQHALNNHCDFLIYHATSSIRNEFSIGNNDCKKDHFSRYWTPTDTKNKSVVSNSWADPTRGTGEMMNKSGNLIKQFFTEHIDFSSMVGKNYIFIDYTLNLIASQLPRTKWAWNRGGFEHYKFTGAQEWEFSKFTDRECQINLWDDYDHALLRPYYHVVDINVHKQVRDHYLNMLELTN